MKITVAVLFALVAIVVARPQDTKYTTKYDGLDLDEVLRSDRLFNNYYKCLLDKGKCTPDGSELKRNLPDALLTNCSKCSDKQKNGTDKVLKYLIEKRPTQWAELQKKYDPENVYTTKFKEEAKGRGIEI